MNDSNYRFYQIGLMGVMMLLAQTGLSFEKPDYTVVYEDAGIEYRLYEPYVVSESVVVADGAYKEAGEEGVNRLLDYIKGENQSKASNRSSQSEKIKMTLPVHQSMTDEGWTVSLMLPKQYSLATAPVPKDERVRLREVPGRLMAVLRYSGRWTEENFLGRMSDLSAAIDAHSVAGVGEMQTALYNPPITPPFMRRNEVMIEVTSLPEAAADNLAVRQAANF